MCRDTACSVRKLAPRGGVLFIGDFGEKARILFESERISEGHYMELLNMISDEREEN